MEHIQQSHNGNDSAASCWQNPIPDLLSFTCRDFPIPPLNTLLISNRTEMYKSLAAPILHFAECAQVNNPLSFIHPLANSLEEVFFLSLVCSDTSANRASNSDFFLFLPNYYIYKEAVYSEVPHLKATHSKAAPMQSKTERVMQECVSHEWGSEWPHKSPGCCSPKGRKRTKGQGLKRKLH